MVGKFYYYYHYFWFGDVMKYDFWIIFNREFWYCHKALLARKLLYFLNLVFRWIFLWMLEDGSLVLDFLCWCVAWGEFVGLWLTTLEFFLNFFFVHFFIYQISGSRLLYAFLFQENILFKRLFVVLWNSTVLCFISIDRWKMIFLVLWRNCVLEGSWLYDCLSCICCLDGRIYILFSWGCFVLDLRELVPLEFMCLNLVY